MMNDIIYGHVNSRDAVTMAQDVLAGKPLAQQHHAERMAVVSDPYQGRGQYAVVRRLVETRNCAGDY